METFLTILVGVVTAGIGGLFWVAFKHPDFYFKLGWILFFGYLFVLTSIVTGAFFASFYIDEVNENFKNKNIIDNEIYYNQIDSICESDTLNICTIKQIRQTYNTIEKSINDSITTNLNTINSKYIYYTKTHYYAISFGTFILILGTAIAVFSKKHFSNLNSKNKNDSI